MKLSKLICIFLIFSLIGCATVPGTDKKPYHNDDGTLTAEASAFEDKTGKIILPFVCIITAAGLYLLVAYTWPREGASPNGPLWPFSN